MCIVVDEENSSRPGWLKRGSQSHEDPLKVTKTGGTCQCFSNTLKFREIEFLTDKAVACIATAMRISLYSTARGAL
jgi:hypothetical protein